MVRVSTNGMNPITLQQLIQQSISPATQLGRGTRRGFSPILRAIHRQGCKGLSHSCGKGNGLSSTAPSALLTSTAQQRTLQNPGAMQQEAHSTGSRTGRSHSAGRRRRLQSGRPWDSSVASVRNTPARRRLQAAHDGLKGSDLALAPVQRDHVGGHAWRPIHPQATIRTHAAELQLPTIALKRPAAANTAGCSTALITIWAGC